MISALALALVLSASCEHPGLSTLDEKQRESACQLLTTAPQRPNEDREALSGIYDRAGFERARERNTGVFAAWLAQLRAWFERIFESSGAETYSNATRVIVLALALAIGATVLARVITRRRARISVETLQHATNALELDDPAVHRQRAESLLASDPRGAIREGWLSVLATLERNRFARPDRVKTNRELVAELPTRGAPEALTTAVQQLVAWFDRSFYSLDRVDSAEAKRFLDDVARLPAAPKA
ncbi:MAG: DUF4129 domain-containing protein [Archangium sp.]